MFVISNMISRGGTGKSSIVYEACAALHKAGYSVVAVDLDSQASLSTLCGVKPGTHKGSYEVFFQGEDINEHLVDFPYGKVLPATDAMSMYDYHLGRQKNDPDDDLFRIWDSIKKLNPKPDVLIFDNPPTLNMAAMGSLAAADRVLITTTAVEPSLYGIGTLANSIKMVQEQNDLLEVSGIIVNFWDPRTKHSRIMRGALDKMAETLQVPVYENKIRRSVKMEEAHTSRMSVTDYAPHSPVAKDVEALFKELLEQWDDMLRWEKEHR